MSMTEFKKVLVVGPSWVGDMMMAQSLFITLKSKSSNLIIDVLAPQWSLPLLARMPEVNSSIVMPLGHGALGIGERYRIGKRLRNDGYTQAILLPNSFKSALLPFWASIPQRTGYLGEMRWGLLNDIYPLDKLILSKTVERFVFLGSSRKIALPPDIPIPRLKFDDKGRSQALLRLGLSEPKAPLLVLCPGAEYGAAKRWPVEKYGQVANHYLAKGWNVWFFGSQKESLAGVHLAQFVGERALNLIGRTSLAEVVDLLSLAQVVVTNDSGLMHVAAAVGNSVVAIYGSSDPGFTPPLSQRARIVSLQLDCSPCFKRDCPLGHLHCLNKLSADRVIAAVDELM